MCLFSSIASCAEQEYEIVLLAPEGQELTTSANWGAQLNQSGFVWGAIFDEQREKSLPFIYEKEMGFKLIALPEEYTHDYAQIKAVNCHGVAVGIYGINMAREYYYQSPSAVERVFVYNIRSGEFYDLLNHFDMTASDGFSIDNSTVEQLSITDTNQIIFSSRKNDSAESQTYIYHLDLMTVSLFLKKELSVINSKGQMIGGSEYGPVSSWFYDPEIGYQTLGSLDKFNRWSVYSMALSSNGIVAGTGLDSYGERKGFIWSNSLGLQSFDATVPADTWIDILAINEKRQAVGIFELDDDHHAFIYSQESGFLDLGAVQNGLDSEATGINNHTQIVGYFEIPNGRQDRAFIWDAEHGMRDLTTLIPQNIGWKKLERAIAINDAGYILGNGSYYGVDHHFLLIPKTSFASD